MKNRKDLNTILPFLPVGHGSSSPYWPSPVVQALKSMMKGPDHSQINSGEVLFNTISNIRSSLSLSSHRLADFTEYGYRLFFDLLMPRAESAKWFCEILPVLARLLLRLPSLLENHYAEADSIMIDGETTSLRILGRQEAGIVLLSQELIASLLVCSFFCLFPVNNRDAKHLPKINFDRMFASLYVNHCEKVEHKMRCIVHYFEKICLSMPTGRVSYERKVLPWTYSRRRLWSKSRVRLCRFQVHQSGLIEDELSGGLEVDFASKYLGGGALSKGCVQEEIRFMINPELIAGMLFLSSVSDNEAIEIVGTQRFSSYAGYASSFRFSGDYVDCSKVDSLKRRQTRIVAIDALCKPGRGQYQDKLLLRETNKAFCGFYDPSKNHLYHTNSQARFSCENVRCVGHSDEVGIVTGNWGCGAFGGDPQLKAVIQWLAASQALRPFISYYTFGEEALCNLVPVIEWIHSHEREWTVGYLWRVLVNYSAQRRSGRTKLGFLDWLVYVGSSISEL